MTFSQDIPWQHDVLSLLKQVINDCQFTNDNELLISSNMQKIWHLMVNNCNISCLSKTKTNGTSRLQLMMHYIHNNYAKCLTLEEICNVVYISKSTSLNLFRKYLNTTPIKYLIKYRLQVASKLLLNSKKTIYSISSDCGFENVDYFCKTFKKHYNVTPSTYRKNQNQN